MHNHVFACFSPCVLLFPKLSKGMKHVNWCLCVNKRVNVCEACDGLATCVSFPSAGDHGQRIGSFGELMDWDRIKQSSFWATLIHLLFLSLAAY